MTTEPDLKFDAALAVFIGTVTYAVSASFNSDHAFSFSLLMFAASFITLSRL